MEVNMAVSKIIDVLLTQYLEKSSIKMNDKEGSMCTKCRLNLINKETDLDIMKVKISGTSTDAKLSLTNKSIIWSLSVTK